MLPDIPVPQAECPLGEEDAVPGLRSLLLEAGEDRHGEGQSGHRQPKLGRGGASGEGGRPAGGRGRAGGVLRHRGHAPSGHSGVSGAVLPGRDGCRHLDRGEEAGIQGGKGQGRQTAELYRLRHQGHEGGQGHPHLLHDRNAEGNHRGGNPGEERGGGEGAEMAVPPGGNHGPADIRQERAGLPVPDRAVYGGRHDRGGLLPVFRRNRGNRDVADEAVGGGLRLPGGGEFRAGFLRVPGAAGGWDRGRSGFGIRRCQPGGQGDVGVCCGMG